jgi:O-antigen/teichoic acid export membrane protein
MLKVLLSLGFLQLLNMIIMMLRTKGLAILLGPELYGQMGALDRMVAVFAQTASLSMPFSAIRYLSPLWHTDRGLFFSLFRRMRNTVGVLALLALLVGGALLATYPDLLGAAIRDHRRLAALALLGLPTVAFVPFLQNTLAASFEHSRAMLFSLCHAVVFAVTALVGIWATGLGGFYGLYALVGGALCFVVMRIIAREERAEVTAAPAPAADRAYLPAHVWRFGFMQLAPAFLSPYVAYAIFSRVIGLHGDVAGGYMQSAMGLALAVRGVLGAAGHVFLTPLVNRPGDFRERVERADNFQKTLFLLVGIVVPPLVLLSQIALVVLYSPRFAPAAPFVVVFVATELLALAVSNYQAVLIAMDHVAVSVIQNVLAQACMFVIAALAVPRFGVVGAGSAMIGAQLVLMFGTGGYLAIRHGFRPNPRVLALSVYVIAGLGVCALVARELPGLQLRALAAKLGTYAVLAGGLALFLDRTDWKNLRALAHELRGKLGARGAPPG